MTMESTSSEKTNFMKLKRVLIPVLAVGVALVGTSQAQAVTFKPRTVAVLDTFQAGTFTIDKSAGNTRGSFNATQTGPVSEIRGGERDVNFTILQHSIANRSAIAQVVNGDFLLDLGPGVKSTATLTWDGVGTSGLNTDLTQGDVDRFALGIDLIDQFANLTFTVTDNQNRVSTLTRNGLQAGLEAFKFNDFIGSADFKAVRSVNLFIDTPTAADLQLEFFKATSVPEPFTIIGSVAALGFGASFRRKFKKKA
jgi:hypothetical protein